MMFSLEPIFYILCVGSSGNNEENDQIFLHGGKYTVQCIQWCFAWRLLMKPWEFQKLIKEGSELVLKSIGIYQVGENFKG